MKLSTIGIALPMTLPTLPARFFDVFQALLKQSENLVINVKIILFKSRLER
jgi:hypothetical protein